MDYLIIRLIAFYLVGASAFVYTGSSVRLITNNQIKLTTSLHSLFDFRRRVICAEDHLHHTICHRLSDLLSDLHRISSNRYSQLSEIICCIGPLRSLTTSRRVRTNTQVLQRDAALRRPFTHRLANKGNVGHEIEHPPASAGKFFGDAKCHERLACATRQDQLAAIRV